MTSIVALGGENMEDEEGRGILEGIFNFFLPQHCLVCGSYISCSQGFPLCPECFSRIEYLNSPLCVKCGRPLPGPSTLLCHRCRTFPFHFDTARAVALYTSPLRDCIQAFKYQGFTSFRYLFGELLCEYLEKNPFLKEVDCLLPVPLHPARLKERGFNQSLILAEEIKKCFSIPIVSKEVRRIKPTLPQVGLKVKERRKNMRGAFEIKENNLFQNKRVLIVDDVLTSRSTVDSLSQTLKRGGAKEVLVLALASGK